MPEVHWKADRWVDRLSDSLEPPILPSQTMHGSPDAQQAGRDIVNIRIEGVSKTPTNTELRTAVLQQFPRGRELLESASRAKPENLDMDYEQWVGLVKTVLGLSRPDLATLFDVAPGEGPTRFDYDRGGVTFGMHKLWPDIWKKIRVLERIDAELAH